MREHADELREGYEKGVEIAHTLGGKQKKLFLYREGVIKLGFFIRSKQAKTFRQWATNLIVHHMDAHRMEISDLFKLKEAVDHLREDHNARFDMLNNTIQGHRDEIDDLRSILDGLLDRDDEKKLRALIQEVKTTLHLDGRAVIGRVKKGLGVNTPYAKTSLSLAMNFLNNMLGRGLETVK